MCDSAVKIKDFTAHHPIPLYSEKNNFFNQKVSIWVRNAFTTTIQSCSTSILVILFLKGEKFRFWNNIYNSKLLNSHLCEIILKPGKLVSVQTQFWNCAKIIYLALEAQFLCFDSSVISFRKQVKGSINLLRSSLLNRGGTVKPRIWTDAASLRINPSRALILQIVVTAGQNVVCCFGNRVLGS